MFKRRTTFVVGAGCSKEFGLPVGFELVQNVYDRLMVFAQAPSSENPLIEAIGRSRIPGINANLTRQLQLFARGIHSKPSIDQYLDFHSSNSDFVALGKMAIADEIIHAESNSKLGLQTSNGTSHLNNTWLFKLFHLMNDGILNKTPEPMFRNVKFICFNYDTCIETFFYYAIKHLLGCSWQKSLELIRNELDICHPYGTVGDYSSLTGNAPPAAIPFGNQQQAASLILSAQNRLRIFTERVRDQNELNRIHHSLLQAEQVVFMGFSYLDQNMELLSVAEALRKQTIHTLMTGIPQRDMARATDSVLTALKSSAVCNSYEKMTASQFMTELGNTLRR